jgi:hypothetical protein
VDLLDHGRTEFTLSLTQPRRPIDIHGIVGADVRGTVLAEDRDAHRNVNDSLDGVLTVVLASEVRQSFDKLNAPPIGGTADAFTQLIRREHDRWVPLIRALGIVGD